MTVLSETLVERLRAHRDRLRGLYEQDRVAGLAGVWMPEDVSTTQIYTHLMNRPGLGLRSPLDAVPHAAEGHD